MSQAPERPDLHKLFNIADDQVQIRHTINQVGYAIRQKLAAGAPIVIFQVDRDVAAMMASIFILDDPTI